MLNVKAIVAAAVGGFLSAFLVDLHAWSQSEGAFDWTKAVKRWTAGAVAGASGAAGFTLAIG